MSDAPYFFGDKMWWHTSNRDKLWDAPLPCLIKHNERKKKLMTLMLLALDESMPGWFPETSKLGGLPNHIHKPIKPMQLGPMLKNTAERKSNIIP